MKCRTTCLQKRLYLISAIILLVGLSCSALLYLTAGNDAGVAGYETEGGNLYPVSPEDTKKYMHDLELYGGKANVLVSEFVQWFRGLWHGRSLAYTVTCISILAAFGVFFTAKNFLSDTDSECSVESEQRRPS